MLPLIREVFPGGLSRMSKKTFRAPANMLIRPLNDPRRSFLSKMTAPKLEAIRIVRREEATADSAIEHYILGPTVYYCDDQQIDKETFEKLLSTITGDIRTWE